MKAYQHALLAIGATAALMSLATPTVRAKEGTSSRNVPADSPAATGIDAAIDFVVASRGAADKFSAADVLIMREQLRLQFLSLTTAKRDEIFAASSSRSDEGAFRAVQMLKGAVESAARQLIADRNAQRLSTQAVRDQNRPQPKFGALDNNLVFVATPGPCRVADTRNIATDWPGPIPAGTARQIWAYSATAGYTWSTFQGGTGTAGSGNCGATVYPNTGPVDVVATVTVVNTSSFGALQAWDGGPTLTVGAALVWGAGDLVANTTIIRLDRLAVQYPNSGPYKRDFAVNNNSATPIDVVIDVVGYFVKNTATALDCTSIPGATTSIPPAVSIFLPTPSCPAGYTPVAAEPNTQSSAGLFVGTVNTTGCLLTNVMSTTLLGACDVRCCRLPGL